ncbi:serine/threonine protein kinase [Photobacterium kishitanii]|uniref:bifunctional protein-serine/threonine kinase/phosphatase n=1 Tax=Photobacterium kishitanii TaxID=318456 RepID=UPI000D16DD3E|nr:bifunctional protein-serine/threonine kinase/phosphatase [Photobacterium kishitanii]PSW63279.1 serine/threonine protein kinase [Photobacterium kishitanii]
MGSNLAVCCGGYSDAGTKPQNQDAFAVLSPSKTVELQHKGVVACIADGVSCSHRSYIASQLSVTHFIEDYLATATTLSVKDAASSVLNTLNLWLFHHDQQAGLPQDAAVTSFSVVIIKSNTAHIFHIGDCRVYLWRDNDCRCLTQDHRRNHHDGQHYLTRALGMDSHLQVDYQAVALNVNDKVVMTTDGVHDSCDVPQSLDKMFSSAKTPSSIPATSSLFTQQRRRCLEQQAHQLVTNAQQQGSQDNASCVILDIVALPMLALDEVLAEYVNKTIPVALNVGQRIDQFVICRVLDAGCRSHIYLAQSDDDNGYYVLKMPSPNMVDDSEYLHCFVREGWLGQQCQHVGVMKIFNHNAQSVFLYHVCEFVEGLTLRQWMIDNPLPSLTTVRVIVAEIVTVIRTLQRQGIYHADIKPDNIMLRPDLSVTLIDFGSAWINGYQELVSTLTGYHPHGDLNYLAPECHAGGKPSLLSEQFSLGIVIYEMLTGSLPYQRLTPHSVAPVAMKMDYTAIRRYRQDLPIWLESTLKKSCHPYAQYRYQALSELVMALSTPASLSTMLQQPLIERNPLLLWQCISTILLVIVLLQGFWSS